jgi:hypothetical protein
MSLSFGWLHGPYKWQTAKEFALWSADVLAGDAISNSPPLV